MLNASGEDSEVQLDDHKYDEVLTLLKLLYPTSSNVTG